MTGCRELRWRGRDGASLFARDYPAAGGAARLPVVCIHGLTRNSSDFEDVAPWLAASGRRVLAVDVRGRGRSEYCADPMNYRLPTYARDMQALFDALGMARVHIIGTSMGGLIAMMLAARRNSVVTSAILNDVGPEIDADGIARIAGYAGKAGEFETLDDVVAYLKRTSGVAFPNLTEHGWRLLAERSCVEDSNGRPMFDYDPAIAIPIMAKPLPRRSLLAWLLFLRLARSRPTLLLRGELSDLLSRPIAQRLCRAAPRMAFAEIPGVGHAPLLTEETAKQAISHFLDGLP